MKRILVIVAICFVCAGAQAQSKTYSNTLKKYMEVSGSLHIFKSAIRSMLENLKSMNSNAPAEFWNEFEAEFTGTSIDDLVAKLAPVYEKHISEADLNEIIKFYQSPAGKRLSEKTPAIMEESMLVGQAWGEAVAGKVMNKLKEKGY